MTEKYDIVGTNGGINNSCSDEGIESVIVIVTVKSITMTQHWQGRWQWHSDAHGGGHDNDNGDDNGSILLWNIAKVSYFFLNNKNIFLKK